MSREVIRVAQIMGPMIGGGVEATVMNHYRHIDHSRVQFDFVVNADSTVVPRAEIESMGGACIHGSSLYADACLRARVA